MNRPPERMSAHLIALEIGGSKLQIVTGTADGAIQERARFPIDPSAGGDGIRQTLSQTLPDWLAKTRAQAIGVGFGGPVDGETGRICCSHQVKGWHEFPLREWLYELSGLPVVVENDSNCAALGEALCGAGKGCSPVFYFNLGSGVGGGLVVQGELYHGQTPGEVEFGHLRLDREGTIVEDRCSGWAVDRKIRELRTTHPESLLNQLVGGGHGCEARHLPEALRQGDSQAQRIIEETAADLAFALSHAVHLFHPEVIVLGGGLALAGEPLRAAVAGRLSGFVMEAFHPVPETRLAGLGEDAVPVGTLLLAGQLAGR